MLAHTRKHLTNHPDILTMRHAGVLYLFPRNIAEMYRADNVSPSMNANDVFSMINKKYTKPGALLRGIRIRENLSQIQMAKKLKVTQSDVSQMETGTRNIGRKIGKRIEKLFKVNYRSFLE